MEVNMTNEEILNYVDDLCEILDTKDPFEIAERLGIKVEFRSYNKTIKGYYHKVFGKCYIIINNIFSNRARKIICAHELGHALLHVVLHEQIEARSFEFSDISEAECEANFFAAALLLDHEQLNIKLVNLSGYLIKNILKQNIES
jgi:Zn-dependent peptidase ImmA (M78 family)